MATQYTAGLVTGEVLTAATMNSIGASWETWTPALTASTTNPTLGSGSTATGRYTRINKLVVATFTIVFGSSPNAGSGTYRISLPITAQGTQQYYENTEGTMLIRDNSTQFQYQATFYNNTTTTIEMAYSATYGGALVNVSNANPWTWAASDSLSGLIIYEAA
jgi:hypothetical protein